MIAQHPIEPRDSARLCVLDRQSGAREHKRFHQIGEYLNPGDLLVVNRSRVIPGRVFARKLPGGGRVEILLLEKLEALRWKALVGGKGLDVGIKVEIKERVIGEISADLGGAQREIKFNTPLDPMLNEIGNMPLPPYITAPLKDPERYQTVFSKEHGSAAAPTAGLHFTPQLIRGIAEQGVEVAEVLLHVGLDTFAPVNESNPKDHKIHSEWCSLPPETADAVNACKRRRGRVIAVGTTSVRVLETAAQSALRTEVNPFQGRTNLFILPGYEFRIVDVLITNFHLPRSTLLMLASAFAGRENILEAYQEAIESKYRFYSFGDAMLIL